MASPGEGPNIAALAAAAAEPMPETPYVSFDSQGVVLIYGRDERAIEAAKLLENRLDVTVLLTRPGEVSPPRPLRISPSSRARSAPPRAISAPSS